MKRYSVLGISLMDFSAREGLRRAERFLQTGALNTTSYKMCIRDRYDYGDSIRFGTSTGAEDEQNLDLIWCDLELFEIYTKGYVEGCGGSLTEKEIRMMPMGEMCIRDRSQCLRSRSERAGTASKKARQRWFF